MVRGKPVAIGMLANATQSQRHRVSDQEPEDAAASRTGTDDALLLLIQPDGQELFETRARFVEHAQSAISGVDQRTGFGNRSPEQFGQLDVTRENEDRRQQSPQLFRVAHPGVGHEGSLPTDGSGPRRAIQRCVAGTMD